MFGKGVTRAQERFALLIKSEGESLHNPIAIIPLPLRVTAMGKGGGYDDDDTVQSSFQIWDDLRPMQ
jgi:hypothetical protein